MNQLEDWIEVSVGYSIDWEATGSWLGAVGSIAAVIVTAVVALAAWRGELERRRASSRAAAFLALHAAKEFAAVLNETIASEGSTSPRLTSTKAKQIIAGGAFREVLSSITDLRPVDMPGPGGALAFVEVRKLVRDFESRLAPLLDVPGSAGRVNLVDLRERLEEQLAALTLNEELRRRVPSRMVRQQAQRLRDERPDLDPPGF